MHGLTGQLSYRRKSRSFGCARGDMLMHAERHWTPGQARGDGDWLKLNALNEKFKITSFWFPHVASPKFRASDGGRPLALFEWRVRNPTIETSINHDITTA
jgi:hypothetical protein